MASGYTANYQLNQWEGTDKVLREEFNQDNAKIDGALAREKETRENAVAAVAATVPKIVTGTYIGDGAASRTISLGFTPKAVFLCTQWGETSYYSLGVYYCFGGLVLKDHPAQINYTNGSMSTATNVITIMNGGFQVACVEATGGNAYSNYNKEVYHYIAIG